MRRGLLILLILGSLAGLLPVAPATTAARASDPTQLTPTAAKRMMRTVLQRELGRVWSGGTRRRLDCSTAVHPQRGGATQKSEIRRRCYFSWRHHQVRFHGRGLIWLSGRDSEGRRRWVFQMTVYERRGDRLKVFRQSGAVQMP